MQEPHELPGQLFELKGQHSTLDHSNLVKLGPIDAQGLVRCIVETPANSRSKFDYDEQTGLFELDKVLPAGMAFPFDFGFIPMTLAEDGDPLDVMLLLDQAAYPGVVVRTRLVGILKAKQTERDGKTVRNDRLLAVHIKSIIWHKVKSINDLPEQFCKNIEHFFENYNELEGKQFHSEGWHDTDHALEALNKACRMFMQEQHQQKPRKAS